MALQPSSVGGGNMPSSSLLKSAFLRIAIAEIGTEEVPRGSNKGPKVSEYQARAGYGPGVFWCLCYVYWCMDEAAKAIGVKNPLPRTGSCDDLLDWSRRHGKVVKDAQPGDIFLVLASENDAIHTGVVVSVNADGTLVTMEGNSNNDGSSNGYAVVRRTRRNRNLVFVRVFETVADVPPSEGYVLKIGGNEVPLTMVEGTNYAPVREVVKRLGLDQSLVTWQGEDEPGIYYNGKIIPAIPINQVGTAILPVRALAKFFGATLAVEGKVLTFKRAA